MEFIERRVKSTAAMLVWLEAKNRIAPSPIRFEPHIRFNVSTDRRSPTNYDFFFLFFSFSFLRLIYPLHNSSHRVSLGVFLCSIWFRYFFALDISLICMAKLQIENSLPIVPHTIDNSICQFAFTKLIYSFMPCHSIDATDFLLHSIDIPKCKSLFRWFCLAPSRELGTYHVDWFGCYRLLFTKRQKQLIE